jgi:SnoaL-like domain
MSEYEAIAQRYIDSWNETDADKRRAILDDLYTSDASFTDPLVAVTGPEAIDEVMAGAQQQFSGLEFTLGTVDGHHDIARFTWLLGAPGADEPLAVGFDVIVLAGDRIRHVHGFLDKVPA